MKRLNSTKLYKKSAEVINSVKSFLKEFGMKKSLLVIFGVIIIFLIVSSFFQKSSLNLHYETHQLSHDYGTVYSENTYSYYLNEYKAKETNLTDSILPSHMVGSIIVNDDENYKSYIDSYYDSIDISENQVGLLKDSSDYLDLNYDFVTEGFYYFKVDYLDMNDQINDNQIAISINGSFPYHEARTLRLPSKYYFETSEFLLDRYNNEIQPSSLKDRVWETTPIKDYDGIHPGYFGFYIKPGDTVKIHHISGKFLVGQVYITTKEVIQTYEQYLNSVPNIEEKGYVEVSARDILYRNSASIRLRASRDPSSKYYDTQYLKLNTISGDSWLYGGEAITYNIDVENSGLYNISFKYRQNEIKDMSVFRKVYVNGVVPFKELEAVSFPYTTDFINRTLTNEDNEPLKVYLEAGVNAVTLEVVNYPNRNLIENVKHVMREIQSLSLAVKKYTAGGTDKYRDWDIEIYFPHAKQSLLDWATLLEETYQDLLVVSQNNNPTEISNLKVAAVRLRKLANNINKLPSRMVQFSDGDSSVNQLLGDLMQRMMRGPMEIEKIMVSNNQTLKKPFVNIFVRTLEGFKRLVLSYFNNPYTAKDRKDNELTVWVNHPRQYIEIMQMLIDLNYDSDLKITLSQMPDENKLILANTSGQSPDVAIGVNHWLPYEFAIRDAALDLRQFEGFEEITKTMSKGAFIPMVFEDGVFGIPETQNYWVTYYRTDILQSIGINSIPQTWDEIIEILPILQSYGMNYFVPLAQYEGLKPFVATLPYVYQFGGDLYTADGMETAINSEQTLQGIKLMGDLFTLYNLPQRVGSFYNEFRYGLLPIGISDLSMYLLLTTTAVELDGLWHMDLHPGQPSDEGILRYAPVGGQTSMVLSTTKYPKESFDFIKWWMSTETQTEFQFRLETTYGKQYFWNSANNHAFMESSIPAEFKEIIFEQWDYAIEAARIPGAYMVERSISNAWSEIVYNGANPRLALDEAVRVSNREIKYKMTEFGYVKDGVMVKPYIVPSIYNIENWLTEVDYD